MSAVATEQHLSTPFVGQEVTLPMWTSLRSRCMPLFLAGMLTVFSTHPIVSAAPTTVDASSAIEHDGVLIEADGTLRLLPDAPPPPAAEPAYSRYGYYLSPVQTFSQPTFDVRVTYAATVPTGSGVQVAVRASADGQQWSTWETEVANGATLSFPQAVSLAQYRVVLLGTPSLSPVVSAVQLTPVAGPARYHAMADEVAPTYKVRGTRMGMVGGRTANGHIIRPHDHFVSLPSWRSLSSRNGYEYQVRITYNGRSAVAPVWDVGPWNTRDDYWSPQRERFPELRPGWPQDHAAYFEKHNGGYAEKGYVRFPTAIDVGDGVWWDELGIVGDQAEVEVTFLWMGRDPLAAPPPPPATEVQVSDDSPAFRPSPAIWYHSPVGCGAGGHAFWSLTTTNPAQSKHHAHWQPQLTAEALYDVYVHIPVCETSNPFTAEARYLVQHRDGISEVVINQAGQTGWVNLGRFPFAAGDGGFVRLANVAGADQQVIWFDDAKWVPVSQN